MTLDEAIIKHIQIADSYHKAMPNYAEATDHRQLAEWLTDYKELKNSIGAAKFSNMKEVLELIREYKAENIAQKKLIAEYKRLLKAAVEDFAVYGALKDLPSEQRIQNPDWRKFNRVFDILDHQWRYADEALALIGEDGEQNENN